jgi:prevent-host-death family protein
MKVINVQDAKTHLSRLLEQVAQGEDIVLGKHGRPMARLTAYAPASEPRKLGGLAGQIQIGANFDDEDDEVSALFYGTEA